MGAVGVFAGMRVALLEFLWACPAAERGVAGFVPPLISWPLAFVSCVPVLAGRGVTRLEVDAGLEGGFGGVVLEEVCRWGGMEALSPGGLAMEGEDFFGFLSSASAPSLLSIRA